MAIECVTRKGRRIEVETLESAVAPKKQRRTDHFAQVSLAWLERLNGASGKTYKLAINLVYLSWREKGGPIVLSNAKAQSIGLARRTKWHALSELERRRLISVERHPRRSPKIRLINTPAVGTVEAMEAIPVVVGAPWFGTPHLTRGRAINWFSTLVPVS